MTFQSNKKREIRICLKFRQVRRAPKHLCKGDGMETPATRGFIVQIYILFFFETYSYSSDSGSNIDRINIVPINICKNSCLRI